MPNTILSPNMNLPVPVVGVDPGPDWANDINACLSGIDSHNHSSGQGVQITPDGLDISSDLPMSGNNLTTARSVRFTAQSAPLAAAADVGCLYESGVDLYYNDGSGNQVRITQGGSVTGSSGTITGLPSGTASASFAGATFTFVSATNTPAAMAFGPVTMGRNSLNSKTVTISPNAAQAANFNITWPAALPGATNYTTLDSSGNVAFNSSGASGSGAVVLATSATLTTPSITSPTVFGGSFSNPDLQTPTSLNGTFTTPTLVTPTSTNGTFTTPTISAATLTGNSTGTGIVPLGCVLPTFPSLSGAYVCSATTAADSNGFVKCNGQVISDVTSPMNGVTIPSINSSRFLFGSSTDSTTGGASTSTALVDHVHNFAHIHGTAYSGATNDFYLSNTPDVSSIIVNNVNGTDICTPFTINAGSFTTVLHNTSNMWGGVARQYYTSGVTIGPSGTGSSAVTAGTSSPSGSFSILPPYITAVYIMRVK